MKQLINLLAVCALGATALTAVADTPATAGPLSVSNSSGYTVEFSGLIGGYSSQNPLPSDSPANAVILPDPGSNLVRGHIMVYSSTPGQYVDNIVFVYQQVNGVWQVQAYDLYNKLNVVVNGAQIGIGA